MAEAPSPYAPGIISHERAPPRPPARPVVFLVATFVMTALAAGLWQTWAWRPNAEADGGSPVDLFRILATAPAILGLLWAYLSDRVPVMGSRREGYVVLAGLVTAVVWLGVAAGDDHPWAWRAAALPFGLADAVSRVAILGALAQIGRRRTTTGRLAALNVGLAELALLGARALMMPFSDASIWLTAGIAVGLALALVLLVVALSDDDAPALAAAPETHVGIPSFLRSRAFWASLPVLACAGILTMSEATRHLSPRVTDDVDRWQMQRWFSGAGMIGASIGYTILCRRIRFRNLLRLALLVKLLMLVGALGVARTGARDLVVLMLATGDGLVAIAVLDLALRAAPPGREAFGAVALHGAWIVIKSFSGPVTLFLMRMTPLWTLYALGAAIVGIFAASLLPRAIAGTSDGQVIGSPP